MPSRISVTSIRTQTSHIASDTTILVEGVEPGHDSAKMAAEDRRAILEGAKKFYSTAVRR
jgi:hypothetical protein